MKKVFTINIDDTLHYQLKIYCARNNITMGDFIAELIKEKIKVQGEEECLEKFTG